MLTPVMSSLRTFLRTPSSTTYDAQSYQIPSSPSFTDFHAAFQAEHGAFLPFRAPPERASPTRSGKV